MSRKRGRRIAAQQRKLREHPLFQRIGKDDKALAEHLVASGVEFDAAVTSPPRPGPAATATKLWLFVMFVEQGDELDEAARKLKHDLERWLATTIRAHLETGAGLDELLELPARAPGPRMTTHDKLLAAMRVLELMQGNDGNRKDAVKRVAGEIGRSVRSVDGYFDEYRVRAEMAAGWKRGRLQN